MKKKPKTMYQTAKDKIKNASKLSKINLSIFAVIFAGLGVYVIVNSRAATTTTTTTATSSATTFSNWAWDARSATVDPNNATMLNNLLTNGLKSPNLNMTSWSVATADAKSGDPEYSIPRTDQGGSITVRIALGTKPDPSGDGHLTVRDVEKGIETDFWQAIYDSTTQRIKSTSAAVSFPLGAVNEGTTGWGGNAANTPLRRGLVTPEAINAGVINETLQVSMPNIAGTSSSYRFPALHNAPTGTNNSLPEGTWFRLDPSLDINSLNLPAWEKVIAKALQDHGAINRDNGGTFSVYGRNPLNDGAAWSTAGLSGSSKSFSAAFPWSRLQILSPPPNITTPPPPPPSDTTPPIAPTTVTATATAYNSVSLSWSGATDDSGTVASYDIYRGTGTTTPTFLKNVTTTSTTDTTVSASTSYSYYIKAKDAAGNVSPASATKTVTTPAAPDTQAPSVPSGVTATPAAVSQTATKIDLSWTASTDNNSVAKYRVYINGSTTPKETISTSYSDTGLPEKTTYSYQVSAVDAAGNESAKSPSVSATTPAYIDQTVPVANVTAPASGQTVSGTGVSMTASATDNVAVTKVDFYVDGALVSSDSASPYGFIWNSTNESNSSHTVQVYAYDAANNLGKSAIVSFSVFNDATAPSPAPVLSAVPSETSVALSWTPSNDNVALSGYRVLRGGVVKASLGAGTTAYTDSGLTAGTTYSYSVVAYDAAGNTATSNLLNVTTLTPPPPPSDSTPPTVPTGLKVAIVSTSQVNLSWDQSTDTSGIAGYYVYRDGKQLNTNGPISGTSFGDTGLVAGITYSYTVAAVDNSVNKNVSAQSPAASVTIPVAPPPSTSLTFSPTDDAYVNSKKPTTNYRNATSLLAISGSLTKYSLFKFNVSGVSARTVTSAKLKLYANNSSNVGGFFHKITNNTWTQDTVTWNNKPAYDVNNLASLGAVSSGTWVEVDLTSLFNGDGTYGLLVNSNSGDTVGYASKETSQKPQLTLTVQ